MGKELWKTLDQKDFFNVESLRNLNMLICIVTLQNKGILYSF